MLRALTLCLVLILLAACGSNAELPDGEFLTPGGLYRYTEVQTVESSGVELRRDSAEIRLTQRSVRESHGDLHDLIRVDAEEVETGRQISRWYQSRPDGLYEVAHSLGMLSGSAYPRPEAPGPLHAALDGFYLEYGVSADSFHVRDQPRLLYPIPMRVGAAWAEFNTDTLRRVSRVTAQERVQVESGSYDVLIVESEVTGLLNISVRSYIDPTHGMVLREQVSRFPIHTQPGQPSDTRLSSVRIERLGP